MNRIAWLWLCGVALGASQFARADVVFSEIMYHPASEDVREEFIELHNTGGNALNLAGWSLSSGVRFTFQPTGIPAGGYLVVAADTAVFNSLHPDVANVVGNWEGILSNSGEKLELLDSTGKSMAVLHYADEGDWGLRVLSEPDYGHRGWKWTSLADGGGHSLELATAELDPDVGQNWLPSAESGGTPGAANSRATSDGAPLITKVSHFPALPRSNEPVFISARIRDELPAGLQVELHHRVDGAGAFTVATMHDDGQGGDGSPNDGVFGVQLSPQPNGTIVEFFVRARDAGGSTSNWPAAVEVDGTLEQNANALYQVTDAIDRADLPVYRLILKDVDRAELRQINRNSPSAPYSTSDQTRSHAQFNGTFVSIDGAGTTVRYRVGIRNRGNGSRSASPQSFRVNFPNDDDWKNVSAINLNSQQPHAQLFGSALYRHAGLPTQEARAVHVLLNGGDLAVEQPDPFPYYVCNEVLDSDFIDRQFPHDSSGNLYRGIRLTGNGADLHYEGEDPDPYRENYFKRTNTSEDDWTDLIELTRVLDETPDDTYEQAVLSHANLEEWMLYFAVETLVDNRETNLANGNRGTGEGDDYFLYTGVLDPRALILPYDLDSILGEGTTSERIDRELFQMTAVGVLDRLMKHPHFAPLYYAALDRMLDRTFSEAQFVPLIEQVLTGMVDPDTLDRMRDFALARAAFVRTQIPHSLTAVSDLTVTDGLPQTSAATADFSGRSDAIRTRRVVVNGVAADWSAWETTWTVSGVPLVPGENRLLVQAFDENDVEFLRTYVDVRRTGGAATAHSGTLGGDEVWTVATGPHRVTGSLTVPAGTTLTLEPGATVYFDAGTSIEVQGTLLAEGTESSRIHLTREPGTSSSWGPLAFQSTQQDNRLVNVDFGFSSGGSHSVGVHDSRVRIEGCTWTGTTDTILELDNATADIRRCVFPTIDQNEIIHGNGMPANGHVIVAGNFFGSTTGYSDVIDFTGGHRPGPILQVYDNIFSGGSDDALDLDGTDAHVEGNIFTHFHQDAPRASTSNAIATDNSSEITSARNLFYDNDHAALLKNDAFLTSENNTMVGSTIAAINFGEPERDVPYGRGASLENDIVWSNAALFQNLTPPGVTIDVTATHSILQDTNWPGPANLSVDPRLMTLSGVSWDNIREAFVLGLGSPALGSGLAGLDRGALVADGARIGGGPVGETHRTDATFELTGPGLTHLKWRLDEGPWSAEVLKGALVEIQDLTSGEHRFEAIGKNSAAVWQAEPDAATRTWTVDPDRSILRLNEVLVRNESFVENNGTFPGFVELYNDGGTPIDLGGFLLTTSLTAGNTYAFPAGTMLDPEDFVVLWADAQGTAPGLHLGFPLSATGGELHLLRATFPVPELIDSVRYGLQLADLSIGRADPTTWVLNHPTPGALNEAQWTGDPARLRLNEWLPASRSRFPDDYLELCNTDTLPVALDGVRVSDNPIGWPDRFVFPPLSFIAPAGLLRMIADGSDAGGLHLPFRLSAEQGMLGLADADGTIIDRAVYESPWPDVAVGRMPDGTGRITNLPAPSPGGPNPPPMATVTNVVTEVWPLVELTNSWSYFQDGAAPAGWNLPEFDDHAWPTGEALLYVEEDSLPAPKNTPLNLGQLTYYFRTSFDLEEVPEGVQLRAFTVVDDGCIVWLNGQELLRNGMDPGAANHNTPASRTVGEADFEGPYVLPSTLLHPGNNVLAVEVHQTSADSSDIVMGLSLDLTHSTTNIITTGITNVVSETRPVFDMNNTWSYFQDGAAPAGWNQPAFPDAAWPTGEALLYVEGSSLPAAKNTPLTLGEITYYFRTHFNLETVPEGAQIKAYTIVDDGMIAWLNGQELFRNGMDAGNATYDTRAGRNVDNAGLEGPFILPGDALQTGDNLLAVEVHQTSSTSSDIVMGMSLELLHNITNVINTDLALHLNEALVVNHSHPLDGVSLASWVELHNTGDEPLELDDRSLTDDPATPRKWVFTPGTTIPAHGFLTLACDPFSAPSAVNTALSLLPGGGQVYLFDRPASGGGMRDALLYGVQTPDLSLIRDPDGNGAWALGLPTPNAPNQSVAVGDPHLLRINEWMARPDSGPDWFELYNPGLAPVVLDGMRLSDDLNDRAAFAFPPLSFIGHGPHAWLQVFADDDLTPGFDHVPFKLSASGEAIGLFDARGYGVDSVLFGGQANGVSEGRLPDGATGNYQAFDSPTPGASNSGDANPDRDGDGMPNVWEELHGLNPDWAGDALLDGDGDGLSNLAEYQAGTDPNDPESALRLEAIRVHDGPADQTVLRFTAAPGRTYSIVSRETFSEAGWTRVADVAAQPCACPVEVVDDSAATASVRFYLLITPALLSP
ncbi:MAG: lamin tail domain-containing protein [Verrucomicrobiales bacterium]|nr:lamin tail domain-containing protein [Verrucomicrobiales bacterium]